MPELKIEKKKTRVSDDTMEGMRAAGCCHKRCVQELSWGEHRNHLDWYVGKGEIEVKNTLMKVCMIVITYMLVVS